MYPLIVADIVLIFVLGKSTLLALFNNLFVCEIQVWRGGESCVESWEQLFAGFGECCVGKKSRESSEWWIAAGGMNESMVGWWGWT